MFFDEALRRYSCRNYSSKEIPAEILDEVLKIVPTVPTAHNDQAQHVYVFQSSAAKEKLEQYFSYRFNNPVYLLVTIDEKKVWCNRFLDGQPNSLVDGSIVLTHLMFQAEDFGLKTCWIGNFDVQSVQKEFLSTDEYPVGILTLGYPAPEDAPSPRHLDRKDVTAFITYL